MRKTFTLSVRVVAAIPGLLPLLFCYPAGAQGAGAPTTPVLPAPDSDQGSGVKPIPLERYTPKLPAELKPPPASHLRGLSIQEGFLFNLAGSGDKRTESHKITYRGEQVIQNNALPTAADTTNQFLKGDPAKSDANTLALDLTQGTGEVKQSTLNALGIDKFSLIPLNLYPFTSVTRLAARLDGKAATGTFGFETNSIHPLSGLANWVRIGSNIEQTWQQGDLGGNRTTGTATFRAFVGDAQWTRVVRTPQFTYQQLDDAVRTFSKLRAAGPNPTSNEKLNHVITTLSNLFVPPPMYNGVFAKSEPPPDVSTQAAYDAFLQKWYAAYYRSYSVEPSVAYWLEGDGWYTYAGKPRGPRFQGAEAGVLTFYRNVGDNASDLQVRYETGFDRANPGLRFNRLFITLGLNF